MWGWRLEGEDEVEHAALREAAVEQADHLAQAAEGGELRLLGFGLGVRG